MNISFMGFGENTVTFQAEDTLTAGVPVKITAQGTAAPCEQGDKICGMALSVRDGYAAIQLKGYAEFDCDEAIDCGYQYISAGAEGTVQQDNSGKEMLVVASSDGTAGIIL